MHTWLATGLMGRVIRSTAPSREKRAYWGPRRRTLALVAVLAVLTFALPAAFGQQGQAAPPVSQVAAVVNAQAGAATQEATPATPVSESGGEANLKLPDLSQVSFLKGINGSRLVGIAGSYGVACFGIRVNTFANSRTAFAGLKGKPYPIYAIPLKAGMSIGMMLISVELLIMLCILLFIPGSLAGACFIGFAIGESLGAAALRIAGGIFTKIADIGSDLMKIVFKIKEDDARNPGVIADCTGDNAGDSVGPSADGFETYGVTGVALISFILLAVPHDRIGVQVQ